MSIRVLSLLLSLVVGIQIIQAMDNPNAKPVVGKPEESIYIPQQVTCPYPLYFVNECNHPVLLTVTVDKSMVTKENVSILHEVLLGLTHSLPLPGSDLNNLKDGALETKLQKAEFAFELKPKESIMLPGMVLDHTIKTGSNVLSNKIIQDLLISLFLIEKQPSKRTAVKIAIRYNNMFTGYTFQTSSIVIEESQIAHNLIETQPDTGCPLAQQKQITFVNDDANALDLTLIVNPSEVTRVNGQVLQALLTGRTIALTDKDIHDIVCNNIQNKFKSVTFEFTLAPKGTLLLPCFTSNEQINLWKKRFSKDVWSYPVSHEQVQEELTMNYFDPKLKNNIFVYVKPAPGMNYGFVVKVRIAPQRFI